MAIKITRYSNNQVLEVLKPIGWSENFTITPDDRIELVQTINGVTIADGGRYPAGDRYTLTVVVDADTYNKIKTVWRRRELVDVELDDGTTLSNYVLLVRSVSYYDKGKKMTKYKKLDLELWAGET